MSAHVAPGFSPSTERFNVCLTLRAGRHLGQRYSATTGTATRGESRGRTEG